MKDPIRFTPLLLAISLTGCDRAPVESVEREAPPPAHALEPGQGQFLRAQYLPPGAKVPPGVKLTAIPRPFVPGRDRAIDNTQPEANLARIAGVRLPSRGNKNKLPLPTGIPGSGERGFGITTGHLSMYAVNDAQTDLVIPATEPDGAQIFAPTFMPSSGSCVEMVTVHYRLGALTKHAFATFSWCSVPPTYDIFEEMNSSWRQKYVRSVADQNGVYEDRYTAQVEYDAPSSCWYAMLYNYLQGAWEFKNTYCSPTPGPISAGWTMWESYNITDDGVCPSLPAISSVWIHVLYSSGWDLLYPSETSDIGPTGSCWTNGTYTFHIHGANFEWHAHTPGS